MAKSRFPTLAARHGTTLINARHGTTAVEFALLAPALMLILFGAIEFGRLIWTQAALHFAVEEAARCASVTPSVCGTSAQVTAFAANAISPTNIAASAFTFTTPTCGHQVSASFAYQFVVTGLFPFTPTLTAQACFP
jgi:Flp pilus assembly protein TadG